MNEIMLNNSRFNEALQAMQADRLPDEAYKNVGVNPDGTPLMMVAANFKFAVEKGKKTEIEVSNPDIARLLYEIQAAGKATNEIDKFVARKLYKLSEYEDAIKKMNFDSVTDLVKAVFGMSPDWSSKRIRIGKYFINDEYKLNPVIPSNWSMSHVQELLQYLPKDSEGNVDDTQVIPFVMSILQEGIVADGMTTKAIREALTEAFPDRATGRKRKALKAGKDSEAKAGKDSEAKASGTSSDIDVTDIDRLKEMSNDAKVGIILSALQTVESVFPTLNDEGINIAAPEQVAEDIKESLEYLRSIARLFVK